MRKISLNLQQRISLTLLGFAVLAAVIVGTIGYVINESIEHAIWKETLESELEFYLERKREDPEFIPARRKLLATFARVPDHAVEAKVPESLEALPLGISDEIEFHGRAYCILVQDVGSNRYYVMYDITELEAREGSLIFAGLLALFAVAVLVLLFSVQLARWLLHPINDLAERVSSLNPSQLSVKLAEVYYESEVKALATAFDGFLNRLKNFILREQDFVSMASHELRTPIAVISGAVDVLGALNELPQSVRAPFERIKRNARDLEETITGLLFLARENRFSSSEIEICDVENELPAIVENHQHLIGSKDLRVSIDESERTLVRAPNRLIAIVLGNLIRNAIQHTQSGEVKIRLKEGKFQVRDTGFGMSPEQVASSKLSPEMRKGYGGLGLYIVHRIAAEFGWDIALVSGPGQGTTVTLSFGEL